MYISRIDGDVVTYDIRMKRPNNPENEYLENASMHTFEHLLQLMQEIANILKILYMLVQWVAEQVFIS